MKPENLIELLQDVWVQRDGDVCKAKASLCWVLNLEPGAGYMAFDQHAKDRMQARVDAYEREVVPLGVDFIKSQSLNFQKWADEEYVRYEYCLKVLKLMSQTQPQIVIHS